VPNATNPQAFNRYTYVLNNPLKYTDPSGHGWWSIVTDVISIAFDVQQMVSHPSWANAGWLALDVGLTLLPGIPAGAGPIAKAVDKSIEVVKGADKILEGTKDVKNAETAAKDTLQLLKDAKITSKGHLEVTKDIINEIGKAESKGVDFSSLTATITSSHPEIVNGVEGGLERAVKYSDSQGTKFVIHEVYDSEGVLVHRDFDAVRIKSGQMVDVSK